MKASPLVFQVEKIFRHARQGSIETRRAYKKCMLKFATWLAENYNMQNLRNISNKHLAAYVAHNLSRGNAPSYIIKQLSAIRYTHDHLVNPRYSLEKTTRSLVFQSECLPVTGPGRNGSLNFSSTSHRI